MIYLGARLSFRYNCNKALQLSVKLESYRPFGGNFIVFVVYYFVSLSSLTFLKNSLLRYVTL